MHDVSELYPSQLQFQNVAINNLQDALAVIHRIQSISAHGGGVRQLYFSNGLTSTASILQVADSDSSELLNGSSRHKVADTLMNLLPGA